MPTTVPGNARSKAAIGGAASWQVGQVTLKKNSPTGPSPNATPGTAGARSPTASGDMPPV